jgi:hypothetical protein
VLGKTAARHTSAEFVAYLTDVIVNQPRAREIHVLADNLSTHKWKYFDPTRRIIPSTSAATVH